MGWPLGLIALTGAALVLRVIGLDGGLWYDELASVVESFRVPLREAWATYLNPTHHPFYALLANALYKTVGDANWVARLPAMLFGVATVPALFFLARDVAGEREAWWGAALLTVSYHHVWFSQNARGYTMLAFFTVVCTHLVLRGLRGGGGRVWWWYAGLAALGAYTHLTMVFNVVAHALVVLGVLMWMRGSTDGPDPPVGPGGRPTPSPGLLARTAATTFVLAAIGTLVLYAPILTQVIDHFVNVPSELTTVSTPGWAIEEGLRVLRAGMGSGAGILVAGTLFAVGAGAFLRSAPVAFFLFVAPGVVTVVLALLTRGTMYPRFFFSVMPFGVLFLVRGGLLVGRGVGSGLAKAAGSARASRWGAGGGAVLVGAMVALSLGSLRYNYRFPKQDFEGAAAWVDANVPAADEVVTVGVTVFPYSEYLPRPWTAIDLDEDDELVRRLREQGTRVWVVYVFPRYLAESHPRLMVAIERECVDRQQFDGTLGSGDILVCALPPLAGTGD